MALWTETEIKDYASKLLKTSSLSGALAVYVSEATNEIFSKLGRIYDADLDDDSNIDDVVKDAVRCLATSKAIFFNYIDDPNQEKYFKVAEKLENEAFRKINPLVKGKQKSKTMTEKSSEFTKSVAYFGSESDIETCYENTEDYFFSSSFN